MRLALDAMGGDNAPQEIISGALEALKALDEDDIIVLVGQESVIRDSLKDVSGWENQIEIVHAEDVVAMEDSPVEALRRKKDSSMLVMAQMAAEDNVDAVISAGNTGAFAAACQMKMRLIEGVQRPGILIMFPTEKGPIAICDVGANISPKPQHMHQYAIMVSLFMEKVMGDNHPTVGLISIGEEDAKGNDLVKTVNAILHEENRIVFAGNIEPRDLLNRPCSAVICDGFTGNVILKLAEGIFSTLLKQVGKEIASSSPDAFDSVKPILDKVAFSYDHTEYGGAPLMGINGTCIICHGSASARAIKMALLKAKVQASSSINTEIAKMFAAQ